MPPKMPLESKLAILMMIKEKKSILFGKSRNDVENAVKVHAWEEILVKAKSLQLVAETRCWQYVRDNLYGVWKCRAFEKRENAKRVLAASGGRRRSVAPPDKADEVIFEIVGEDALATNGLDVGESGRPTGSILCRSRNSRTNHSTQYFDCEKQDTLMNNCAPPVPSLVVGDDGGAATAYVPRVIKGELENDAAPEDEDEPIVGKRRKRSEQDDMSALVREKKALQVELLRMEIYKRKLDILKLEKELGLPVSRYTKDITANPTFQSMQFADLANVTLNDNVNAVEHNLSLSDISGQATYDAAIQHHRHCDSS